MTEQSAAGDVYGGHVESLLAAEYDRRKTLESRGAAIVTTSSSILTLILGLTVVITGKDYSFSSTAALGLLIASLVTFVGSAIVAILVQNYGMKYTVTGAQTLEAMVQNEAWNRDAEDAKRMCLKRQINTVISLRSGNNRKALLALWSLGLQVGAIAILALALTVELISNN